MSIKDGICPKCSSDEIYASVPVYTMGAEGHSIFFYKSFFNSGYIFLQHYACLNCRYLETYIEDEESVNRIVENWQPLKKEKRKNDG
jgi:hypothetical protein